jgi:hypothetical protein
MTKIASFVRRQKLFILITVISLAFCGWFLYPQFKPEVPTVNLPGGFPVMPIYPKAKLVDSKADPDEGSMYIGVRYGATWKVDDQIPEVAKWYAAELQKLGWTLDTHSANPDALDIQSASLYKDDQTLNMSYTSSDSKTTIITVEFNSHIRDVCDDSNGKICK